MEGLHLASAGDDVKLWDCSQGVVLLHQFNPHSHNVASVSWNFDGSFLASCSINDDAVVLTYTKNNALTSVDLQCGAGVQCVDFNSNSRYILCGGTDGVSVWDLKTKSLKKSFKEAKGPITAARYNWNDSYIAAGSEKGEIILHNTITGQSSSPLLSATAQAIRQLEYSGFKKSMFGCTSDDGVVTLWDANARRQLHIFQEAHVGPATGLAFSPINEMLMISVGLDKRMVCYDIQKKKMLKAIDTQSPLTCIDIMHDGATAAVGSTRGKIYFYDLRQGGGSPVYAFQAHKTSVQAVRFMPLGKIKSEIAEGMQNTQSMSSHRRQLPQSPRSMQNITSNRQMPDSVSSTHPQTLGQTVDIFSPAAEGVQSQHCHNSSLSATQLSLTNSRGEDSYAGVFSPLTNGKVEQLSSHSFQGASSLLSTPSFLGQVGSSVHSPLPVHQSHHMSSGLLNKTSNSLTNYSSNYAGSTAPNASQSAPSQHPHSPQGSGASPSLPRVHKYSFDATLFHDPSAATASSVEQIASLPVLQLSPSQDLGLTNGEEENEADPQGSSIKDCEDVHTSSSTRSSQEASPGRRGHTFSHSALLKMAKADLKEYREQLRQEFSSMLWGKPSQLPGSSSKRVAVDAVDGAGADADVGSNVQAFQTEFLRNLVADAMEELRDEIHRDIQSLHVDMLRQFHNFHMELQSYLTHYADMNRELMMKVKHLEEENKRLKKHF